jgi:glycosyltransferase 2 family protein
MKEDDHMTGSFNYKVLMKWALTLAIFLFLVKMVWGHWNQVKEAPFTFRPFSLILSTLIFVLSYFIQLWAWYLITLRLGIAISLAETLKGWFYSQLGKYLPGKVWLLLGRFYYYESKGKSKKIISVALYFETVTLLVAAGLIFLSTLSLFREMGPFYSGIRSWWVILLGLFGFISLHPRVLQKLLNYSLFKFRRDPISVSISYPNILWILMVCIIVWVVEGIGFYLFVDSIYPVSTNYILFLTGALAISTTLGLIAIFAPSGLGVREGALVTLLSLIMPSPVAVIISLLTRLWMTLIEIGLIGVVYLLSQFQKGFKKNDATV